MRHAVTKMSHLHFPAAEIYRQRIIQMGESPDRVINVGALGVENILNAPLLSYEQLCEEVGIPLNHKYVVVTFHPVTLELEEAECQVQTFIDAMMEESQYFYLITKANADAGGWKVNEMLEQFASRTSGVRLTASLGMVRYLSAVKYCEFVLGNSSSGIIEAPAFGTPTVNIGNRQKGRLMAETIISCENSKEEIITAMQKAAQTEHRASTVYGSGNTSEKITEAVKDFLEYNDNNLKKQFYDIERSR